MGGDLSGWWLFDFENPHPDTEIAEIVLEATSEIPIALGAITLCAEETDPFAWPSRKTVAITVDGAGSAPAVDMERGVIARQDDLFEVADPETGEPVPDGTTGELVYTPLDGRGSIVMRYRTGDLANGGMTHEPCPACGRTVPRFSSDLSRASNKTDMSLTKIKGALVNLNVISDLLTDSPVVDEWQVVLSKRNDDPLDVDEMRIAVSVVEGQQKDNTGELLASQIQNASEVRPSHMELLDREEMLQRLGMETQLKEKRIVDLRKQVPSEESGDSSR
jgi:phenylacetate-coenzyme A ligase PaaK-like adenylate-forming protein